MYVVPHFKMVLLNEFASALCFVRKYHTSILIPHQLNQVASTIVKRVIYWEDLDFIIIIITYTTIAADRF